MTTSKNNTNYTSIIRECMQLEVLTVAMVVMAVVVDVVVMVAMVAVVETPRRARVKKEESTSPPM